MLRTAVICILAIVVFRAGPAPAQGVEAGAVLVAAPQADSAPAGKAEQEPSPEEKMNRRFPQPVRVGDLIGLPVLDWQDSTIGYIRQVVRTPAGKIQLIVPYGKWLGWAGYGGPFDWGRRPVAVPIETVAILGRQVAALDMPREEFDGAPTYVASEATQLAPSDMIRIAITRR
jgi:hypothetical protein